MKFPNANRLPVANGRWPIEAKRAELSGLSIGDVGAFTIVEIAICLAIIGVALVGIIGVLPYGLNTQRDTRQETVINQDVATLLPLITQGARGADDLTNYVYAIVNIGGVKNGPVGYLNPTLANTMNFSKSAYPTISLSKWNDNLTNGANIIGLLSTPEFITNYDDGSVQLTPDFKDGYSSNHIIAYVRSLSGLATEKPPQNNDIMLGDSFGYRIYMVNAPVAQDTNIFNGTTASQQGFAGQLAATQHELRMTFYWPLLPNGNVGSFSQTFRATVAGQLAPSFVNGQWLYYYQSQSFAANTNNF